LNASDSELDESQEEDYEQSNEHSSTNEQPTHSNLILSCINTERTTEVNKEDEDNDETKVDNISCSKQKLINQSSSDSEQISVAYNQKEIKKKPCSKSTKTVSLVNATAEAIENENKRNRNTAINTIKTNNMAANLPKTTKNLTSNSLNTIEPIDSKSKHSTEEINQIIESQKPITLRASVIAYQMVKKMMKNVYSQYPELQLPGHILYIYQLHPNRRLKKRTLYKRVCSSLLCCICNCFESSAPNTSQSGSDYIAYDSRFATQEEFKKIVVTTRMLTDHFPNNVESALQYFNTTNRLLF
jgi:hypothetical protein